MQGMRLRRSNLQVFQSLAFSMFVRLVAEGTKKWVVAVDRTESVVRHIPIFVIKASIRQLVSTRTTGLGCDKCLVTHSDLEIRIPAPVD